jgi:hypothetical protein
MSRRDSYGQYAKRQSPKRLFMTWAGALLSVGLLYFMGKIVVANFTSFRSCEANQSGLTIVACGRGSFSITDVALIGLFILSAALAVSSMTAALRTIRRRSS